MTIASEAMPLPAQGEGESERSEVKALGFWLYLMTDAVIFALLFATYLVMIHGTAGGPTAKDVFSLPHTFAETVALLFSTTTFGMAMVAAHARDRRMTVIWLVVTLALGLIFIGLEISEFVGMVAQNAGPQRSGFLTSFFTLVATHGLHVTVGMLSILVMIGQILIKGLTEPVVSRLYRLNLFWHFLDIVWIGIFTIVYLYGVV